MRIISRKALRDFWQAPQHGDAEQPLKAWFREARLADWATPAQVKQDYRNASVLRNSRLVFNIAGNKYRLVVKVNYPYRIFYVRFIGTHRQYDKIDAEQI